MENKLGSLHVETGDVHPVVEVREVNHRAPPTGDLGRHKKTAVEARGRRRNLCCFLPLEQFYRSGKSRPADGIGAVAQQKERNGREGDINERGPNTWSGEPVPPRDRHPTTPKPPNVPLDTPPPCRMRDMTPISENWNVTL